MGDSWFVYDERLGIEVPYLEHEWGTYPLEVRSAILERWETIRGRIPDRILALERRIRELQRQLRARFFDGELFADPTWDMLLDLTAARVEHTRVSVTSLCIASGVPPTTTAVVLSSGSNSLLRRSPG